MMLGDKAGLDPKLYDFAMIDSCPNPLWRVFKCPNHRSYNDIVAVLLPLADLNLEFVKCGCMKPYNESAREEMKRSMGDK